MLRKAAKRSFETRIGSPRYEERAATWLGVLACCFGCFGWLTFGTPSSSIAAEDNLKP